MPRILLLPLFLLVTLVFSLRSQTILGPGDIMMFSMTSDMGPCGLPALSDEISFICFKDIETNTQFEMTDNGWEAFAADRWDDIEGTLSIVRTGGTVPRGTMITLQCINLGAGNWQYRIISPDNQWTVTNINVPGGPFDFDGNGDQVYWMQGGTWNNNGGFSRRATYGGRVLFGATSLDSWVADGTIHHSNLHPDVIPCYYNYVSTGLSYHNVVEYAGLFDETDHFGWLDMIQPQYWATFDLCSDAENYGQDYTNGPFIQILDNMGIDCAMCTGCTPWEEPIIFVLPDGGTYDIVYTNGIDTFYVSDVENGDYIPTLVDTNEISYWMISVEESGSGCPVYGNFHIQADITATYHNPGLYTPIELCSTYTGPLDLFMWLNGNPEAGGDWSPALAFDQYYYTQFGEGHWYYVFKAEPIYCDPDTASVEIIFVDYSDSYFTVECDINGTPNDITDDRMVVTLTVVGDDTYPNYYVQSTHGVVSPLNGMINVPTTFTLSPGTATANGVVLTIHAFTPLDCYWEFPIDPIGFCSDPCKYDMEAYVIGPEEICAKNCPDNPETMTIELEGGTDPYTVDFSVNVPGFPAWTWTSIPMHHDANEIQICVDNVPAPVFSLGSMSLTIPESFAGSSVTFSLDEVYDDYGCVGVIDPQEFTITINGLPPISTTSLKWCSEQMGSIDLTQYDYLISGSYEVQWFDGDPLQGGDLIFNPNVANFNNINSLWAYVTDDICENSIQVPFEFLPTPNLAPYPPIEICPGTAIVLQSLPLVDLGNSMATYSFHSALPPTPMNMIDPLFFEPTDSTTIYVHAKTMMCFDTLAIQINVQPFPTFLLEGQPCDLLNETYSIVFSGTADSIASNFGTVINSMGQDSVVGIPNDSTVIVTIFNASGLCTDEFVISPPNCNCPFISQPIAAQPNVNMCEGEPIPQLSVTVGAGLQANWYNTPAGGAPFLQNSLVYQPLTPTSATYYVEAFDPSNACYSIRTAISLGVNSLAQLQPLANPVGCEGVSIDFNTFIPVVTNGVAGAGQWYNLANNQPVSGVIIPSTGDSYYYQFASTAGGCLSYDTIIATVDPLPTMDLYSVLCDEDALTFDLLFTSDATTITSSFSIVNQVAGTDSFSLTDIPFDTDIQFTLVNDVTGCTTILDQAAPNCSCPNLLDVTSTSLCSSSGVLDLSAFVGPGADGFWQLVSAPPGGNPATLTGASFDGQNADAGAYQLRFIRNIILDDCVDTAFFNLQLTNAPTADAGADATVCAPDDIVLNGTVTGTNAQFSWQENGGGSIANPNQLSTTYTPTQGDITNGTVSFTLTATDPTGACPAAQETIVIDIDGSAYYVLNAPAQTYCDTSDIQVDLDALISFGVTSGEWFFPDTVSAPVTGSSVINPSDLAPGTYTIFYTSTTAVAPCKDDTTAVSLVIRNCACPSVALNTPMDGLCSESGSIDLSTLVVTTEPGTWSIAGTPPGIRPATLNGAIFMTNQSDPGIYTLRYTLTNPVPGCDAFAEIDIEVIPTPTLSVVNVQCADDLQSWEVTIQSSSPTITVSNGTLTSLGGNQYLIENISLQNAIHIEALSGNNLCLKTLDVAAPDCDCDIEITNLPDAVSLCPEDKITLEPQVTDGKGTVTSYWVVVNDTLYQSSLEVTEEGVFEFVAIDSLGCKDQHAVDVIFYEEMVPDVSAQDVQCPGDADGIIFLNAIVGGNGPYFISVNGAAAQPIGSFPYMVTNLSAGSYMVELSDGFNCAIQFNISISSASAETLSLGPDQAILVGDSAVIQPILSFTPDTFFWSGDISLLDPDQLDHVIRPEVDQMIHLTAIDEKGCVYEDDLRIRVLLESSIYVPTIFSPNGDGINDLIFPMGDPSIVKFEYFEIYDRWGEAVYAVGEFLPGQSDVGWDGTMRGKAMRPAVFVYRVAAENKRGSRIVKMGDITLYK